MKVLVCEMCGGHDLIKIDSLFVCQNCNVKYTVEEAKKIVVEQTVDLKGSVQIDRTQEISNLYELARRSLKDKDYCSLQKYYEEIIKAEPESWEAYFFIAFAKGMNCPISKVVTDETTLSNCEELARASNVICNSLKNTFLLIDKNIPSTQDKCTAIQTVYESVAEVYYIFLKNFFKQKEPSSMTNFELRIIHEKKMPLQVKSIRLMPKTLCDSFCDVFERNEEVMEAVGLSILKYSVSNGFHPDDNDKWIGIIKKYEPTYLSPQEKNEERNRSNLKSSETSVEQNQTLFSFSRHGNSRADYKKKIKIGVFIILGIIAIILLAKGCSGIGYSTNDGKCDVCGKDSYTKLSDGNEYCYDDYKQAIKYYLND